MAYERLTYSGPIEYQTYRPRYVIERLHELEDVDVNDTSSKYAKEKIELEKEHAKFQSRNNEEVINEKRLEQVHRANSSFIPGYGMDHMYVKGQALDSPTLRLDLEMLRSAGLRDQDLDRLQSLHKVVIPAADGLTYNDRYAMVAAYKNDNGEVVRALILATTDEQSRWHARQASSIYAYDDILKYSYDTSDAQKREVADAIIRAATGGEKQLDTSLVTGGSNHTGATLAAKSESSALKQQAGRADVRVLSATAAAMGLVSAGVKAGLVHALPAGVEAAVQSQRVFEVQELAEKQLAHGQITQAQFDIIADINNKTMAAASLASAAPDPTGLATSDQAVKQGDQMLVDALVKTGMSPEQAQQYELGSLAGALEKGSALAVDGLSNAKEVQQLMASSGQVPMSMALGLTFAQLQQILGPMVEKLGGKALQEEIVRNPVLEKLSTMPIEKINLLGQLVAAGKDPKVSVDAEGNISVLSQRPVLPTDSKLAIKVAAEYFANSGDYAMRASPKDPQVVQVAVKRLGEMYAHLAQDGGLSNSDIRALNQVTETLANTVGLSQQAQNDRSQPVQLAPQSQFDQGSQL